MKITENTNVGEDVVGRGPQGATARGSVTGCRCLGNLLGVVSRSRAQAGRGPSNPTPGRVRHGHMRGQLPQLYPQQPGTQGPPRCLSTAQGKENGGGSHTQLDTAVRGRRCSRTAQGRASPGEDGGTGPGGPRRVSLLLLFHLLSWALLTPVCGHENELDTYSVKMSMYITHFNTRFFKMFKP